MTPEEHQSRLTSDLHTRKQVNCRSTNRRDCAKHSTGYSEWGCRTQVRDVTLGIRLISMSTLLT